MNQKSSPSSFSAFKNLRAFGSSAIKKVCRSILSRAFHFQKVFSAYYEESAQIAKQFFLILSSRKLNCAGLMVYLFPGALTSIHTDSPSGPLPQMSGKPGVVWPDTYLPTEGLKTAFASTMSTSKPSFVRWFLISKTTGPSTFWFFFFLFVLSSRFEKLLMAAETRFL